DDINLNGLLIDGGGVGTPGSERRVFQRRQIADHRELRDPRSRQRRDRVVPTGFGGFWGALIVSNTLIAHNSQEGVPVRPNLVSANASFNRAEFYKNGADGLFVSGTVALGTLSVLVTDSVAASNANRGIFVGSNGAVTILTAMRSAAVNNGTGMVADQ